MDFCRTALGSCFVALLLVPLAGQRVETPSPAPVELRSPVVDKNFYLLSLLEQAPAHDILAADSRLRAMAKEKREALHQAATECKEGVECFTTALRFRDEEIAAAAEALKSALHDRIDAPLRRSGMYVRWHSQSAEDLLVSAWVDCARGINRVIDTYALGKAPRYAAIDAVSFDVKSQAYRQMVHSAVDLIDEQRESMKLFFEPSRDFALRLMEVNHRDEAGRFEPMERGENQGAVKRIGSVKWAEYPYTVIVVPGAGSDRLTWSLSGAGHMRCEVAARRYHQKKAPLILVSGGYVHPNQTPNCEALEMKKALIADFSVPAEAILIDPHARHTTTNLRNAARLMFRYGVPFDRKALIVTDRYQSAYIEGAPFRERCEKELGYVPYRLLGRTGVFDLEFVPLIESLQTDPTDPLDP